MKKVIKIKEKTEEYVLLSLQEPMVFPSMTSPFLITQKENIQAIEVAMSSDRKVFVAFQKSKTYPKAKQDIYEVGTIAQLVQVVKLPQGKVRVLAGGLKRAVVKKHKNERMFSFVQVLPVEVNKSIDEELIPLMSAVTRSFMNYCQLKKTIPIEAIQMVQKEEYPDRLIDLIAFGLKVDISKKYEIYSIFDTKKRLESLAVLIETETEMLNLQNDIAKKAKQKLNQNQKEYYLNEQIREINKELGKEKDEASEVEEYIKIIESKKAPEEVIEKAKKEGKRLVRLQPMSLEAGVLRTYLEWLSDLPWGIKTDDNKDINKAAKILDEDHYNMKKPKERILDYIAVRQLKENMKGPILCFVGPPGTGKTSLGKSVARALDRKFIRMSLGGVRDEAEIRGHRKTYVGALPGRIIQSIKKAGSSNPVILLDEIDKMGSDFKGDPASALLEVLDPEQNGTFVDHYLELPFDFSGILFITTANALHNIPYALRDRMEIIEIPGYTDIEKYNIASDFILPKQMEENGLSGVNIKMNKSTILKIIHNYTMESGVRNLERQIATILRKIAREALSTGKELDEKYSRQITEKSLSKLLGKEVFQDDLVYEKTRPGLVHGMAWTEMGGTLLPIEVALLEGNGDMILTGKLGDVMKESAKTALSYIKANYKSFNLEKKVFNNKQVHIHVPEGAIPKDGPSAGITMFSALVSILKNIPPKAKFAMTGELTLTGRVLPIGGLKEKTLAAYRNKMTDVILPDRNKKDYDELPIEVKKSIKFHFVSNIEEVYSLIF